MKKMKQKVFAAAILGGALLLMSCGFKPMYGPSETSNLSSRLTLIQVNRIDDREGQIFRNTLQNLLSPYGLGKPPLYMLNVKLDFVRQDLGYRKDATVRRARIRLRTLFQLIESATGKELYQSEITGTVGFILGAQASTSAFPEITSEEDARRRLVELAAHEVKTFLGVYLAEKPEDT